MRRNDEHQEYWKKPSFEMSKIIGFELEATKGEERKAACA